MSITRAVLGLVLLAALASPPIRACDGGDPRALSRAYERVAGSTVLIELTAPGGTAYGTGIAWDDDGHIVTNSHVVAAGRDPVVVLPGGQRVPAQLVADAAERDVAVIRVAGSRLAPLRPAEGWPAARIGQPVFALGNPFGRGLALAAGVVSGLDRAVLTGAQRQASAMIQSTVPLQPGNSGGPLFDCTGNLLGMNAAALLQDRVGFAIPAAQVDAIVDRLLGRPAARHAGAGGRPMPAATSG